MATILIIEDEPELVKVLRSYLEQAGFAVLSAGRGDTGLSIWENKHPDLVLLDLNLPGMDGLDVAREIRRKSTTPIIMLTARVEETDELIGLELGADDYVTKPFSPKELMMRVQAVLRRTSTPPSDTYYIGDEVLTFDQGTHQAHINGELMNLTAAEWRVLEYLIENLNQLCTREDILKYCFDYTYESYERVVDTHIKNIRAKLGGGDWIETIRGYGYRFLGSPKKDVAE